MTRHLAVMASGRAAKAYAAGIVAGCSAGIPLVDDGVTPSEVLAIILATVVGFQAVYWTSNRTATEGE